MDEIESCRRFGEAFFTKSSGDDAENIEKFITNVVLIT